MAFTNQQDIATLANVSACAHLESIAKDGLINLEYGRIVILDDARLTEIISG